MKKISILFAVALFAITFTNCSKSGDPAPTQAQKTALDSVKLAMTGTWKFSSLAVMELSSSKSASTSSCAKTELSSAGFANTNWQKITPEFTFVYGGNTSAAGSNDCITASANYAITATQNSDGTVNITFDAGGSSAQVYNVKSKAITSNLITTTFISVGGVVSSNYGYKVIVKFTRQ